MPSATHLTQSYLRNIYLLHIFIIGIPLLYYGIKGQKEGKLDPFAYTYLTLLAGMALVYHGYWLIYSLWTQKIF